MKKRCVIVGGAPIENTEFVRSYLSPDDYMVYCDCGLKHMASLQKDADLIIGDFDSHENPNLETETIILPHVKDDTDTCFAVKECMKRGFTDFLIIGVLGARMDHTLGNLQLLYMLHRNGLHGMVVDDFSDMTIISDTPSYIPDSYPYFSLLNLSGTAEGITVKDAFYEVTDAELTCDYPLGVSNEPLPGKTACVTVKKGELLLIRVKNA